MREMTEKHGTEIRKPPNTTSKCVAEDAEEKRVVISIKRSLR